MTDIATGDGAEFNSARSGTRNIVFEFVLQGTPARTIEDLRLILYRMFGTKERIKIGIITDTRDVFTHGFVESMEPNIFTSVATAQISIICPESYFFATNPVSEPFLATQPLFEFPWENLSLVTPLLEFSTDFETDEQEVIYEGDKPVGVVMEYVFSGAVENLEIFNLTTRQTMKIDDALLALIVGSGIIAGDQLLINTITGSKNIVFVRAGIHYNILNALTEDSHWIQLIVGSNILTYDATLGKSNITGNLAYSILYEGI
jgi:hypothetical protein